MPPVLPWTCATHARRQDGAMRTHGTSVRIYAVTGSLFSDCEGVALPQLVAMASNRAMWRAKVASLL